MFYVQNEHNFEQFGGNGMMNPYYLIRNVTLFTSHSHDQSHMYIHTYKYLKYDTECNSIYVQTSGSIVDINGQAI